MLTAAYAAFLIVTTVTSLRTAGRNTSSPTGRARRASEQARYFDALGFGMPASGTIIQARTVIVSLAVGTIVTVLATVSPVRRATRVPPTPPYAKARRCLHLG